MPRVIKRSSSIFKWPRTSSSNSSSSRRRRNVSRTRESTSRSICLVLTLEPQHPADHAGNAFPTLGFTSPLFAPRFGERIEPRLTVVFRGAPLRADPALLREPQQRGIYCALIQPQHLLAELLDAPRDPVPVQWPQSIERLQHHEIQRPLQYFRAVLCHDHRSILAQLLCDCHRSATYVPRGDRSHAKQPLPTPYQERSYQFQRNLLSTRALVPSTWNPKPARHTLADLRLSLIMEVERDLQANWPGNQFGQNRDKAGARSTSSA